MAEASRGLRTQQRAVERQKLAHLIEQGDDTETSIVKSEDIAEWHRKYKLLTDGPVPETLKPTNEQLSALFSKVTAGAIPYADCALWTPCNAKVSKAGRRFRALTLQANGSFLSKKLAGPSSFST